MSARLETILAGMPAETNPFMNAGRAAALRAQLGTAIHPEEYLNVQPQLAIELLNAGKTEESLAEYDRFLRFLSQPGITLGDKGRHLLERQRAVAFLRLGEQQNCILNHSAASCIMPISLEGKHRLPTGSSKAIEVLTEILKHVPGDLEARWFLNIAHMTLGQYPDGVPPRYLIPPAAFASPYDIGRFRDVATPLGIDVQDQAGGVIAGDFDNDGDLDIMTSTQAFHGQLRLFRNNADGTFTQVTEAAGLLGEFGGLNLVPTDYDNDGDLDAFLVRGGWMLEGGKFPDSLLRNNGDGTFEDVTEEAGMLTYHPSQTATWFDYDADGWLDVLIGNESNNSAVHENELYHNDGDGTFTDCATRTGIADHIGVVKGVASGDYNNDGRPDVYLSIRGRSNALLRNDGPMPGGSGPCDWIFTDVTAEAGVGEPQFSFPTWFFDYDNDGWEDLYVGGYNFSGAADVVMEYLGKESTAEKPRLYHNDGDGTFTDVTRAAGLWRTLHTMGCNYGDLDNDGWLDFYLGTGDPNLGTLIPNLLFRNDAGRRFQDVTTSAGVGHLQKGHGVAFADFDHDGDQDIYQVMGGAYEGDVYRNTLFENPGHGNHWLKLHLEGVKTNRAAIGARIKVILETPGGERTLHRTVTWGASFGGNPFRQEIGLGQARRIVAVEIAWPRTGKKQVIRDLQMDRAYRVREGDAAPRPLDLKRFEFNRTAPAAHHHEPAAGS
ncbi:MAG: CRTAC1 family protein [Candidatus Polarisedimenticolia bacterium]